MIILTLPQNLFFVAPKWGDPNQVSSGVLIFGGSDEK